MFLTFSRFSLLFMFSDCVSAEGLVLDEDTLQNKVQNNSPRHWHQYIRKMMSSVMLFLFAQRSNKISLLVKEKKIAAERSAALKIMSLKYSGCFGDSKDWLVVTEPLGALPLRPKVRVVDNRFSLQPHFNKFYLDNNFRINLTFLYIYFSSPSVKNCYFGRIVVSSYATEKSVNARSLDFCGMHSKLTHYPEYRITEISVITAEQVLYDTFLLFCAIDPERIVSMNFKKSKITHLWCVQLLSVATCVSVYNLKVKHFQTILIQALLPTNLSFYQIYNGPGVRSERLRCITLHHTQLKCQGSSFQSCVYLHRPTVTRVMDGLLKFSGEDEHKRTSLSPEQTSTVLFPHQRPCGIFNLCVLHFQSNHSSVVNVSVIHLVHTGYNNTVDCKFAGLAAYDFQHQRFRQVASQCHFPRYEGMMNRHFNDSYPSIYARKLLLVLFEYAEYSSLSLTLQISTTKCNLFTVNPCDWIHSSVQALLHHNALVHHLSPIVSLNQCALVQLKPVAVRYPLDNSRSSCEIHVTNKGIQKHGYLLRFIAKGYLRGLYLVMLCCCFFST